MRDKLQGKLDRHFTVLCDGHKVRVLKCARLKPPYDGHLKVYTKMDSEFLNYGTTEIIADDPADGRRHIYRVKLLTVLWSGQARDYEFDILSEDIWELPG